MVRSLNFFFPALVENDLTESLMCLDMVQTWIIKNLLKIKYDSRALKTRTDSKVPYNNEWRSIADLQ